MDFGIFNAASEHRIKKDFRTQSGYHIVAGTPVRLAWNRERPEYVNFIAETKEGLERTITVGTQHLHLYVTGISKPPSESRLMAMAEAGMSTTPTGQRVEPDGFGPDGSPSWLLVMGMI